MNISSVLVGVILYGGRSPSLGRYGAGPGPDLGDEANGHGDPDDVVARPVQGLDVDGVGLTDGQLSSAPRKARWVMVLASW